MDSARIVANATVAVILVVTVASGPLVGAVDLTHERFDASGLGEGNASISSVDAPTSGQLDSELGADEFYLKVPDATIQVDRITGKPIVSYRISIPGLGHTSATTHFLRESDVGEVTLSLDRRSFEPDAVTRDEYEGELTVLVRQQDDKRVVYEGSIAIEVSR